MLFNIPIASKKGGVTEIASWNFKDNMSQTVNSKISLSSTITKTESEIAKGYIAPGSEGVFDIIVNAEGSKVKIEYNIRLVNEVNTPNNLYFMILNDSTQEKYNNLTELFNNYNFSGSIGINDEKTKVYKIFWKWPFENYNEDGTIDEIRDKQDLEQANSNLDYIFEIEISGKQSI